jgi:hypothetical protein
MSADAAAPEAITHIVWNAPWSYASSAGDGTGLNGSVWFQLCVMISALGLWSVVVVKSFSTQRAKHRATLTTP